MTRLTVAGADHDLGQTVVAEALERNCEVRSLVRNRGGRWDLAGCSTFSCDLLDLSAPELLFDGCDVVVVPFGQGDGTHLDFFADLHISTVLGELSGEFLARDIALLLVGRASFMQHNPPSTPQELGIWHGAVQLAERAALLLYAMHTDLSWTYIAPSMTLRAAEFKLDPMNCLMAFGRRRIAPAAMSLDGYAEKILDLVEHLGADIAGNGERSREGRSALDRRPQSLPRGR